MSSITLDVKNLRVIDILTKEGKIKTLTISDLRNQVPVIKDFQLNPSYNLLEEKDLIPLNALLLEYKDKKTNKYPNLDKKPSIRSEVTKKSLELITANCQRKGLYNNVEKYEKKIFSLTKTTASEQLNSAEEKLPAHAELLTYILLGGLTLGLVGVGIVSGGIDLPQIWGGIGVGLLVASILTYGSLRVLKNKNETCKKYLEAIHKVNKQQFLFSNINDALFGFYLLSLGLSLSGAQLGFFTNSTFQDCLAYPAGLLTVLSGFHQLRESIIAYRNAKKTNNKEEMTNAKINFFYSISVIVLGFCITGGAANSLLGKGSNWALGAAALGVAGRKFIHMYQFSNKITKVDDTNSNDIQEYLVNNLSLTKEEEIELARSIQRMTKEEISSWHKNNTKNLTREHENLFEQYLNGQEKTLENIQTLILNQETAKEELKKIDTFAAIIDKKTLDKALDIVKIMKDGDAISNNTLQETFAEIKKQTNIKYYVELGKIVLYSLFMIVPGASTMKLISNKIYDFISAGLTFTNLAINLVPKYRNVTPEIEKDDLNMNKMLEEAKKGQESALLIFNNSQQSMNSSFAAAIL